MRNQVILETIKRVIISKMNWSNCERIWSS